MIVAVADTHTVIWYTFANPKLSVRARQVIESAGADGNQVGVSSISLVEMVYLIKKGKIPAESLTEVAAALTDYGNVLVEISLDLAVARTLSRVSAIQIPDMPDRIIAATALHLNVPLVSRDGKIQLSTVQTLW